MSIEIALVGNQNSGKTTLFNQMTGSSLNVGNFPGTTVEKKEGIVKHHHEVKVVDLPGVYSLSPYTEEERITRDCLLHAEADVVVNVIDATCFERSLYLTLQVIEMNFPTVLAVNMMDELRASGRHLDMEGLQQALGIPVVPISAFRGEGIEELVTAAMTSAKNHTLPRKMDFCSGPAHKAIHSIAHIIEDAAVGAKLPIRFSACKLVEGDDEIKEMLALSEGDSQMVEMLVAEMEQRLGTDRDAAIADMRYAFIEQYCCPFLKGKSVDKGQSRSIKIDKLLTHRILAMPIFVGIMGVIFYLTFGLIGPIFNDWMAAGVAEITALTETILVDLGLNPVVQSLIIDGAFAGVGSILSFLPTIILLFFFLALLEGSGYMARVAFVFDHLLRKIGLSGRSFVPMLLGFGCTVPAVMSTRTLGSDRDRKMTILLLPFMSCSAKLPIYSVFTMAFFDHYRSLVMISLYVGGILVGILCALLMKHTVFRGSPMPFLMELPSYRIPDKKVVAMNLWQETRDFITRAFTVIFAASIVIWVLQSFDLTWHQVADSGDSMLAGFGKILAPIFAPLGFGDWRCSTALVTGLMSKETVISTFSILVGAGDSVALASSLGSIFTPLSAFSFLIFTLLYMPCVASFAVTRRELGSLGKALLASGFQTAVAWICAFLFYQIASLII